MQIVDIGADKYHASLLLEADVFFPGLFIHSLSPPVLFSGICACCYRHPRGRRGDQMLHARQGSELADLQQAHSERSAPWLQHGRGLPLSRMLLGLAWLGGSGHWALGGFPGEAQGCCTAQLFQITAQHHLAAWGAHRSQPWAGRISKQLRFFPSAEL